ncbi:hypothetical protein NC651_013468 [Populus alba x Populus x berolinensis]|nr:hypothetical protein NC651_013468 [Populus alba x Populus x berolinensis]
MIGIRKAKKTANLSVPVSPAMHSSFLSVLRDSCPSNCPTHCNSIPYCTLCTFTGHVFLTSIIFYFIKK